MLKYLSYLVTVLIVTSCSMPRSADFGSTSSFVYASTESLMVTPNANIGSKVGTSCNHSFFFGFVTTGDSSVKTAAEKGKISKISIVDQEKFGILDLFGKVCTIVYGE